MEFGGPGLGSLSPDERATLANMATECSAKAGIVEADDATLAWIAARRPGVAVAGAARARRRPRSRRDYAGGVHTIDLSTIRPMVATPGDAAQGYPVRPDQRRLHRRARRRAPSTSPTAARAPPAKKTTSRCTPASCRRRPPPASASPTASTSTSSSARATSRTFAAPRLSQGLPGHRRQGHLARLRRLHRLRPGRLRQRQAGHRLGDQPQLPGPLGPGQLYLASPLNVAASAVAGKIVAYEEGMFGNRYRHRHLKR